MDLEGILKKMQSSQSNPENSYTEKKVKHLQDTHGVQYARLMVQKADAIVIGEKIIIMIIILQLKN